MSPSIRSPLSVAICMCLLWLASCSDSEQGKIPDGLSVESILQRHSQTVVSDSQRSFPGPTLVYVTPWNPQGYDIAKRFRGCKFDYVSPVWYQLRSASGGLELAGRGDVDAGWVRDVRQPCPQGSRRSKIVPRVLFEVSPADVAEVLMAPAGMAQVLAAEAQAQGFDGWVLEAWSYWAALGATSHPELRQQAVQAVRAVSQALQRGGKELVLAVSPPVPAPGRPPQFTAADAEALLPLVAGLSVMTYDYSSPQQPGPNAPLAWVRSNGELLARVAGSLPGRPLAKVWLGLNFYGNEYRFQGKKLVGSDSVVGPAFIQRLQEQQVPPGTAGGGGGGTMEQQDGEQQRAAAAAVEAAAGLEEQGVTLLWVAKSQEAMFRWRTVAAAGEGGGRGSSRARKRQQHFLYYPTPESVTLRLGAARELGLGASVWEIGQGLDSFFDLF